MAINVTIKLIKFYVYRLQSLTAMEQIKLLCGTLTGLHHAAAGTEPLRFGYILSYQQLYGLVVLFS